MSLECHRRQRCIRWGGLGLKIKSQWTSGRCSNSGWLWGPKKTICRLQCDTMIPVPAKRRFQEVWFPNQFHKYHSKIPGSGTPSGRPWQSAREGPPIKVRFMGFPPSTPSLGGNDVSSRPQNADSLEEFGISWSLPEKCTKTIAWCSYWYIYWYATG